MYYLYDLLSAVMCVCAVVCASNACKRARSTLHASEYVFFFFWLYGFFSAYHSILSPIIRRCSWCPFLTNLESAAIEWNLMCENFKMKNLLIPNCPAIRQWRKQKKSKSIFFVSFSPKRGGSSNTHTHTNRWLMEKWVDKDEKNEYSCFMTNRLICAQTMKRTVIVWLKKT